MTFDVDKVELINQNGDGEYIGLATVYSNVAWDFDEKPEFVQTVLDMGYRAAPVVVKGDVSFSGFNPSELAKLA